MRVDVMKNDNASGVVVSISFFKAKNLAIVSLTQHSRNCFASMGEVKFKPHVSFVIGSFQYTKHSDAWPIRVPDKKRKKLGVSIQRQNKKKSKSIVLSNLAVRVERPRFYQLGYCKRLCGTHIRVYLVYMWY